MNKRKKIDLTILFYILIFFIISIITLYSTLNYIKTSNLVLRQVIYYMLGLIIIFLIIKIGNKKILKYSYLIYIINILLLAVVLIWGKEINGTKAWIQIPLFRSLQPSEFMKIGLILALSKIIAKSKEKNKSDINIIFSCFLLFLGPTILTFLEPDTGAVFVYFIITVIMLFGGGIKKKWFITGLIAMFVFLIVLSYLYFNHQNIFIEIFGSNFFYRFDRITNWQNSSGMQLENSLIAISSSGIFGHGFNNIPLYFPELQTDFIFASFIACFGLIGALFLIIFISLFDLKLLRILESKCKSSQLIMLGILGALLYQQIQNIAMTVGLLPITGITLPFISFGGSSLLSYMILIGIVVNINNEKALS